MSISSRMEDGSGGDDDDEPIKIMTRSMINSNMIYDVNVSDGKTRKVFPQVFSVFTPFSSMKIKINKTQIMKIFKFLVY